MTRNANLSRALLAGSVTLALLAGCQTSPTATPTSAVTKGAGQTTSAPARPATGNGAIVAQPATQKGAVTAAEDLAGLLAAEREADDLEGVAAEGEKAVYAVLDLDDEEDQPRKAPGARAPKAGGQPVEAEDEHEAHASGALKPGAREPRGEAERDRNATAVMARDGGLALGQGKRPEGGKPMLTQEQRDQLRQAAEKRAGEKKAEHEKKAGEARAKAFKDQLKDDVKGSLDERQKGRKEQAQARLAQATAKLDKARMALRKAEWVLNEDGTKTKTISFDAGNGSESRSRKIVRTVRQDNNQLVSLVAEFVNKKANGASTTINRSKTLNADGTYSVLFHSAIVLPDGTTRTADWTKTIAVDGKVTGSGSIVWEKDGAVLKTVPVKFDGTVDREKAKAEDGKESAVVEVPVDGAPTASVTDDAGKTEPVKVESDEDGNVEVSDEGEAEAEA